MGIIYDLRTVSAAVKYALLANKIKRSADDDERTRKAPPDFLDLADRNTKRSDDRNEENSRTIIDEAFQSLWIPTSGKGFPVDDCRVLHDWFNSERHSKFHHHAMKVRDPDWIGRNVFLEYVTHHQKPDQRYLESGDNAVRFLTLAGLCGFEKWKESGTTDASGCCVSTSHYVFSRVYPSLLTGLYNVREEHPLMARKLWDMFCFDNCKSWFMFFQRVPDARHLQLMLDVAIKTNLDIWSDRQDPWGVENNADEFSYLNVIIEYIVQNRYDLVMLLLRYGLMLKGEPIDWLKSIYMGLWNSHCHFTASREFKEVLDLLFMVHLFTFPSPRMVQESLLSVFRSNLFLRRRELDENRGRMILHELVEASERMFDSSSR